MAAVNKLRPMPTAIRCAIYTRKSTDEGLDSDFSSLDAQRESAEAFIISQRHEGWLALPQKYDDGRVYRRQHRSPQSSCHRAAPTSPRRCPPRRQSAPRRPRPLLCPAGTNPAMSDGSPPPGFPGCRLPPVRN